MPFSVGISLAPLLVPSLGDGFIHCCAGVLYLPFYLIFSYSLQTETNSGRWASENLPPRSRGPRGLGWCWRLPGGGPFLKNPTCVIYSRADAKSSRALRIALPLWACWSSVASSLWVHLLESWWRSGPMALVRGLRGCHRGVSVSERRSLGPSVSCASLSVTLQ